MWKPTLEDRTTRGLSKKGWRCMARGVRVRRYPRDKILATCKMPENTIRMLARGAKFE